MSKILMVLVAVTAAYGQTAGIRAKVPFEFRAGNQLLPPGQYTLHVDPTFHRMTLQQLGGNARVLLPVHNTFRGSTTPNARLMFQKYGDVYFLRQVWEAAATNGHELVRTRAERKLAKLGAPREMAAVGGR